MERDYYKAKAVVAMMDKFVSTVPQGAASWRIFDACVINEMKELNKELPNYWKAVNESAQLFIEKISDATGIKVPFSVAVQTASKYLPRYRASTGEASSNANGESRSRKRQRTRSSLFSSLFSTESVAV